MNASSPDVKAACEDDLPEVLSLNTLIQPHLTRSLDLLRWQYQESPGKNSRLYLARDPRNGQLIATYGAVSQALQAGSALAGAWMIQDVMTHPEHRGKGHLHMLASHCLTEMRHLELSGYTFPNEQSHKSFARTGWTRVDLIPSREAELPGSRSSAVMRLKRLGNNGYAAAERIWKESGLLLGVARDAAYLTWRYSKPGESYWLFSDDLDYFIALKLFESPGGRIVHVLDLFTRETARHRVADLLAACIDFASLHSAVRATAWLPTRHAYSDAFDTAGFCLKQRPERFFYVDIPAAVSIPPAGWHLTQGDSDVY